MDKKIHIEVARTNKQMNDSVLHQSVLSVLKNLNVGCDGEQIIEEKSLGKLEQFVDTISVDRNFKAGFNDDDIIWHIYRNHTKKHDVETFEWENSDNDNGDDVSFSSHKILPSKEFTGLWESLLFEDGLKERVFRFAETSLEFSQLKVNCNIISCNRLILLHGPPGTGKTSLCRALAQKLSIRMQPIFKYTHLIEINSHSLFSKWFSESGKLVLKLFGKIKDLLSQPKSLVCVLIDEVESLAHNRGLITGSDPKDAIRVVNAILTQLDLIKRYPNVLIFTTSNLTSNIDLAFLDRADIKQYIGYPPIEAIYNIYRSAIEELSKVGCVRDFEVHPYEYTKHNKGDNEFYVSHKLLRLSEKSIGLSGRTLRKLPFIAYALYNSDNNTTCSKFISFLEDAVDNHISNQKLLEI